MSKEQVTIYLDDELKAKINANKGELNKRVISLIHKGLLYEEQSRTLSVNDCIEQLFAVYKRSNTKEPIQEEQKQEPIKTEQDEPIEEETEEEKRIKQLSNILIKKYKENNKPSEFDFEEKELVSDDDMIYHIRNNWEKISKPKLSTAEKECIANGECTEQEAKMNKAYSILMGIIEREKY